MAVPTVVVEFGSQPRSVRLVKQNPDTHMGNLLDYKTSYPLHPSSVADFQSVLSVSTFLFSELKNEGLLWKSESICKIFHGLPRENKYEIPFECCQVNIIFLTCFSLSSMKSGGFARQPSEN